MKKALLILSFATGSLLGSNIEKLEKAIMESDKEQVQEILNGANRFSKVEIEGSFDLAQQIINTRKSDQECYKIASSYPHAWAVPTDYPHSKKENIGAGIVFGGFAGGLLASIGLYLAAQTKRAQDYLNCGLSCFWISFTLVSIGIIIGTTSSREDRYRKELQTLLDNAILIKSIIWRYYNSLEIA